MNMQQGGEILNLALFCNFRNLQIAADMVFFQFDIQKSQVWPRVHVLKITHTVQCICVTNFYPCHRHSDPLDHKTADDADGATEAEADEIEADNPMCRASLGVEATEANAVYRQLGHHADAWQ